MATTTASAREALGRVFEAVDDFDRAAMRVLKMGDQSKSAAVHDLTRLLQMKILAAITGDSERRSLDDARAFLADLSRSQHA